MYQITLTFTNGQQQTMHDKTERDLLELRRILNDGGVLEHVEGPRIHLFCARQVIRAEVVKL